MNIVFLDFDDIRNPLLGAGQATATHEVGKRLAAKGHTITVYSSRYPGYKDRVEDGINYKHIGLYTNNIKINNVFYIFSIPNVVQSIKSADIIIECFTAPISTLFSPLFTKIPVVALPSMFNAKEFSKKYKIPFHFIEKFGLNFYKYMLPYSETDRQKALKLNPSINTKIVTQGVDNKFFKIKKDKPEYILYLGRFDIAQKGLDILLKAYAKLENTYPYPLLLAGHGPDESKIHKIIQELNLTSRVKIVGPAYGEVKNKLISKALFTVFPSRHDEICLWALESLAGGLPLVCFNIPESSWLPDSVSFKAKPFDVDDFTNNLIQASKLSTITQKQNNARAFARSFTWDKVVSEYESYFQNILKGVYADN